MAVENTFNPNPKTVDSLLRERQARGDLMRANNPAPAPVADEPREMVPSRLTGKQIPSQKQFLKDVTKEDPNDTFIRKVGKDAALLAYAIPVGLTKAVTSPIETAKELPGAVVQSVKDVFNPDYYEKHPLLGVVNVAGFVQPLAGVAKSQAIKGGVKTAVNTSVEEAIRLGVEGTVAKNIFKESIFKEAISKAYETGDTKIVSEVVRNLATKNGVTEDVGIRIGNSVADELYSSLSRSSTKMKALEALQHPLGATFGALAKTTDPIRQAIFGKTAETAVARMYGTDVVLKNPEGFLGIEKWAEAQVKERGFSNTIDNRQRMMQEWTENNSQWASLTPEERVSHFQNYAEADLKRARLHEETGLDIVAVKALPQQYVDSMVQTIKDIPKETEMSELVKIMEKTYGRDFVNNSHEIGLALAKNNTRESLIDVISKLGSKRSTVSFSKFSKETQDLADALAKSGYRIGAAPVGKNVSQVTDVFAAKASAKAAEENATRVIDPKDVTHSNIMAQRTAFGRWIDRLGLSPDGLIEGAPEFAFREAFTQNALKTLVAKYGAFIKIDGKTIPVEKLYDFLENHRVDFQKSDKSYSLAIRSVFDIKESDLIRAGLSKEMAKDIVGISKQSLNAIPTEVAGMADSLINYMRTRNEGYNSWMSNVYDKYLKIAYKGRYDWSPFFSFQQWLETRLQGALFLKDARMVPGVKTAQRIGNWTADKLSRKVGESAQYLGKIIDEPALDEVAMVKDEILGTLSKTMLEFNANIDSTAMRMKNYGNTASIADKAAFEQSIASENIFYHAAGTSNVRMASNFNKALAEKYGMTLKEALDYTIDESGTKVYKNPQLVQTMREATQAVYHYQPGLLTSPLMKTMNTIWFPSRFQAKTVKMMSDWLGSLSPTSRMVIMNNWVHFANWSNTEEGIKWRRQNQNIFYNILSYATAYEQIGTSIEAVTKGRLFGGNAGLIGGVPLGVFVGIARQMAYIPSDPDQFDPKTGKEFSKFIPKNPVSLATLSTALEQLAISVTPSTPFYSLTGGEIAGISISKQLTIPLIRQVIAFGAAKVNDTKTKEERKKLDRSFKKVPLDYTR